MSKLTRPAIVLGDPFHSFTELVVDPHFVAEALRTRRPRRRLLRRHRSD